MSTDELQNLASNFRLAGIIVTFIGFTVTSISHVVAERLLVSQRSDKARANERLKASEAELQATKAKTIELEQKLAPRQLTEEQRTRFIKALTGAPKGQVGFVHVSLQPETTQFLRQIRSAVIAAGFSTTEKPEYNLSYSIEARPPWLVVVIVGSGEQAPYAMPIMQAFTEIGIDALADVGDDRISNPGEVKIYIGSK